MVTLLSDIIDSKHPADTLAFFLVAPLRSFTARELGVRLHTTTAKANSAAGMLERNRYLKAFTKNKTKYYLLNLRHPHVVTLREKCLIEQGAWTDELFVSLKKLGQLSGIFLSGLFVGRPELPVDILMVGKVSSSKLDEFLATAQKLTNSELNYSIMSIEEFGIRRDTFDRFIKDIFDYPHVVLLDRSTKRAESSDKLANKVSKPTKKAVRKSSKKSAKNITKKPAKKTVKKSAKKNKKKK